MTLPPRAQRRARILALLGDMNRGLIERDEPARLLLLAALAGEHALLIGPPGTAKSELARRLRSCLTGGGYFEHLLTRFSSLEELFGPLSLKSLERDEFRRLTEGYLPAASVAFLDEIFQTNSVILNPLLALLDDRAFDNGSGKAPSPLVTVIGASHQTPDGPELEALHDRFLLRFLVVPVSDASFGALLEAELPPQPWGQGGAELFSLEELAQIRQGSSTVALPVPVRGVLQGLRQGLGEAKIYVSDRRWRKLAALLRVAAYCDGRDAVGLVDCWLALHCLWSRPDQIAEVAALLGSQIDAALVGEPRRLQETVEAFEQQIELERIRQEQACDSDGQPLFLDEKGSLTTEAYHSRQVTNLDGEALFTAPVGFPGIPTVHEGFTFNELWEGWFRQLPDGLDQMEAWSLLPSHRIATRARREIARKPSAYDPAHVAARRRQLGDLLSDIRSFQRGIAALRREGEEHLWVSRDRCRSVVGRIEEASAQLAAIGDRLVRVVETVAKLPTRSP